MSFSYPLNSPSYVNLDDRRSPSSPITPASFSEAPEKKSAASRILPLLFPQNFGTIKLKGGVCP
ncbi:MAG: hypothetical protein MGG11_07940 [Trichodesmium sp. MAG_R03]|nr:hypothetical protein [Trichodesmium sp. MAG_R03]